MNECYYVIAGNFQEYQHFIKGKCDELYKSGKTSITLSNFVYVHDSFLLRGLVDPKGFFIGTWYKRKDARSLLSVLGATMREKDIYITLKKLEFEITVYEHQRTNLP